MSQSICCTGDPDLAAGRRKAQHLFNRPGLTSTLPDGRAGTTEIPVTTLGILHQLGRLSYQRILIGEPMSDNDEGNDDQIWVWVRFAISIAVAILVPVLIAWLS
jgi:hypothetical protein